MDNLVLESVSKVFRHRPALFNWIGRERNGETRALQDISLRAAPGDVVVLLGPNGSGKTTTLKLISTILLPDSGRVLVDGNDTHINPELARKHVGFAVANERSFFPRLTARENLSFFAALDEVPRNLRAVRIEDMLNQVGLSDAADTLVMKFSTGMYQRLGIARSLLKKPPILLLDEPTRSLDPASKTSLWKLIRDLRLQGTTMLLTTHSFEEAINVGGSIVVLQSGRVVGRKESLWNDSADELRSFYQEATGELADEAELMEAV